MPSETRPGAGRPNILFIFTDQQFSDAMSCAGNPFLATPAMDRIAARGVRFANAYCAYPLCVPSRMSMVTGRMPHEMGLFANCLPSDEPFTLPTMGTLFREAGYDTHWVGKWHMTIPENRRDVHGFEEIVFGGDYGDKDDRKAAEAIEFLKRKHERPFLAVVSFNNPHDCCEWSRGDELRMAPLPDPPPATELPPLPANHAIPDREPDYLRAFAREYERVFPAMGWTETEARRYLWGYYRLVEIVDREIGKVLDGLAEAGLEENTVVVFSSDHGDGASRHRWNQKFSLYDESAKVPFIVARKGMAGAGQRDDRLVSAGLDLLPTLCYHAGIPLPGSLLGHSVCERRDYVVAETSFSMWANIGEDRWPKARMVRSERYKYVVYDAGEGREQLIDMVRDPGEMENLVGSPDHEEQLTQHRSYLDQWCEKTRDSFSRA